MVKLFIGLGLLLFFGGIGAALYGLPYLVLEYGFTFVIGGIVAATGGLVLIGIGVLLKEVRRVGLKLAVPVAEEAAVTEIADTSSLAANIADVPKPDPQGDLFAPGVAKAVVVTAAVGGAALAAARVSPFDKIERALEDVLETTRGDARAAAGNDGPDPAGDGIATDREEEARDADFAFADSDTLALDRETSDPEGSHPSKATVSDAGTPVEISPPDRQPVSSDEGVVRVYTIGDSSFTMYNDGTIRADTPQGLRTFTTMDELKAYLDQRPTASSAKA